MIRIELEFPLPNGLHARPAMAVIGATGAWDADFVWINLRSGRRGDARSVLGLIGTDTRRGDRCHLEISGAGASDAADALRLFIEKKLPGCDDAHVAPSVRAGSIVPRIVKDSGDRFVTGTGVVPGIGEGPAVRLRGYALPAEEVMAARAAPGGEAELAAFHGLSSRLSREAEAGFETLTGRARQIAEAHLAILRDTEWAGAVAAGIRSGLPLGAAVKSAEERFAAILASSTSEYLRERVADIRDVAARLVRGFYGEDAPADRIVLRTPSVLVAEDLSPSGFLALDPRMIAGIVLGGGGATSHVMILAAAAGIPAVIRTGAGAGAIPEGVNVIVDAYRGVAIPGASDEVLRHYRAEAAHRRSHRTSAASDRPATGRDGIRLELAANISSASEAAEAFQAGAEGVGLFRTEMLFLDRDELPGEGAQTAVYEETLRVANGAPVIFRLLDIGGDKPLPALLLPKEENPFLGYRSVRFYGRHSGIIRTQLRAILRAAVSGDARIMIPMVHLAEEIRLVRRLMKEAAAELGAAGVRHVASLPVGIMIEIPAAVYAMPELAPEADFFSIGTNDLCQYFLAVDRGNPEVAALYDPMQPAFWRLLRDAVDRARSLGKWIGVCGDLAAKPALAALWHGLGVDELSVPVPALPDIRAALSRATRASGRAALDAWLDTPGARWVAPAADEPLFPRDLVVTDVTADSKAGAIAEAVNRLLARGRTDRPESVEEAVWAREDLCATGVGGGVAIPHCRTDFVHASSLVVLRLKEPVAWGGVDAVPVRTIILLAIRAGDPGDTHLRIFAALARKIANDDFRDELGAATDAGAIHALISGAITR